MAQVETYRSQGGPPATSGTAMPQWPYYGSPDMRAMQGFGQTLADIGQDWMADHIRTKRNQELGDLDVNLTRAWDDYRAWTQQNLDKPDVDLNEFSRRAEEWRSDMLPNLQTREGNEAGRQAFEKFIAEREGDARNYALHQEKTNAAASFKGNVEVLTSVPDSPFDLRDIADREEKIGSAYWDAMDSGITGPQEAFLPKLKEDVDTLWTNAIINATKHSPLDVDPMIEASPLSAGDKGKLSAEWKRQQEAVKRQQEKAAQEAIEAQGRTVYTDMVNWQATNGQQGKNHSLMELADTYGKGGMTKETYDSCVKMAGGKGGDETDYEVWSQLDDVFNRLKMGFIPRADAEAAMVKALPKLSPLDRKAALNDLNSHYDASYTQAYDSGKTAAEAILARFDSPVAKVASSQTAYQLSRALNERKALGDKLSSDDAVLLAIGMANQLAAELDSVVGKTDTQPAVINPKQLKYLSERTSTKPAKPVPPKPAPGPATIKTDEEYDALPSGATFIAPDGTTRRKP